MSAERARKADELQAWDFMKQVKAQGKAKQHRLLFPTTPPRPWRTS